MRYVATSFEQYNNTYVVCFNNLKKTDSGLISLKVSNAHGEDIKFLKIHVLSLPKAPTNLNAKNITSKTAELYWMPSIVDFEDENYENAYVYQYVIERKTANHSRWRQVAIIRPSIDDDGHQIDKIGNIPLKYTTDELFNDEIYVFRVFAVNGVGKSDPSNTYDILTPSDDEIESTVLRRLSNFTEIPPLDIPSNIQIKTDNNYIELSWDPVNKAMLYEVERCKVDNDERMWLEIANTDRVKFIDRSILQTGKYIYRLTAKLPGVINSAKSSETSEIFIEVKQPRRYSSALSLSKTVIDDFQLYNNNRESENMLTFPDVVTVENKNQKINTDQFVEIKQNKEINLIDTKKIETIDKNLNRCKKSTEKKQFKKKNVTKKKTNTSEAIIETVDVDYDKIKIIETKIELEPDLLTNYTINEGEFAQLTIIWKQGIVDECLWWKDNELLPTSNYTFESNRSIYWVKAASESDAGNYKCQLKNVNTNDVATWDIKVNVNSKFFLI